MAIIRARRSVFGDDIADALAGSDGDALLTPGYASTAPPSPAAQSTGLIPIGSSGPGAPGGSGQSWTNVFQNVISGLFGAGRSPSLVNRAPAPSSSTDTVLVVGGLAAAGLVAYLLMRRS